MTGDELIEQFERGATPPELFHHVDHVRLAFEYLCRHSVLVALEKFSSALKQFAAALGKAQLYHETITWAYLFLIHERMMRCELQDAGAAQPASGQTSASSKMTRDLSWEEFAAANPDLLMWERGSRGILGRYYEAETLASDAARVTFVLPDKSV